MWNYDFPIDFRKCNVSFFRYTRNNFHVFIRVKINIVDHFCGARV